MCPAVNIKRPLLVNMIGTMVNLSVTGRLVLVIAVAVMPFRPCCCSAGASTTHTDSLTAAHAGELAETCCPIDKPVPETPDNPKPCHDDGPAPNQCQLTATCDRDEPFLPHDVSEQAPMPADLEPLPTFITAAGFSPQTLPLDTDVGAFHGDTLRALSCLLTT